MTVMCVDACYMEYLYVPNTCPWDPLPNRQLRCTPELIARLALCGEWKCVCALRLGVGVPEWSDPWRAVNGPRSSTEWFALQERRSASLSASGCASGGRCLTCARTRERRPSGASPVDRWFCCHAPSGADS